MRLQAQTAAAALRRRQQVRCVVGQTKLVLLLRDRRGRDLGGRAVNVVCRQVHDDQSYVVICSAFAFFRLEALLNYLLADLCEIVASSPQRQHPFGHVVLRVDAEEPVG